jgi:hypothetical protein
MDKLLSARQRRPSMAKRKKRRIGAFSRRLLLADLDLRTNAGKFANSIKEGLEAQIGAPTPGQQILIKLVAIKVLRCEMMYDQVLSNPRGGDLEDRIENYFLAWSCAGRSLRNFAARKTTGIARPRRGGSAAAFRRSRRTPARTLGPSSDRRR